MSEEAYQPALVKVSLTNTDTTETKEVQFNPTELQESVTVNWTEHRPPGLPHTVLQYDGTTNHTIPLELWLFGTSDTETDSMDDMRRFLLSLCYPSAQAADVLGGAPPKVLFLWPGKVSIVAVIKGQLQFSHKQFNRKMRTTLMTVSLTLEEARITRLTSEEVRVSGTQRTSGASR